MKARAIFQCALLFMSFCLINRLEAIITTLSQSDPTPAYTADNPFALLGMTHYEYLKERKTVDQQQHFSIEMMPFYQRASRGQTICGSNCELGDIGGRWNMIALLPYNAHGTVAGICDINYTSLNTDLPCGHQYPQVLVNIRDQLLYDIGELVTGGTFDAIPEQLRTVQGLLDLQHTNTTLNNNFGFFSVPMSYRKSGIRFNAQFYIGRGVGATLQTGFADIRQCAFFNDMTVSCTCGNPFNKTRGTTDAGCYFTVKTNTWIEITRAVSRDLMAKLDAITSSTQLCANVCSYRASSMEDLHGELFWRYPTQINKDETNDVYPKFLFIPYFAVGGSYAISKPRDVCQLTSTPFGDNGHSAARFRGGLTFDFYDSIQLSFEGGITAFKSRTYCNYPTPTNPYQYPIYPFTTSVRVSPGNNWHAALGMFAQNFWYNWTSGFTYIFVSHDKDCITTLGTNNAAGPVGSAATCRGDLHPFTTEPLICKSEWSVQVFNASLGYVIAPNFSLNFMMQIPITRRNCYRSSTFMGSIYIDI